MSDLSPACAATVDFDNRFRRRSATHVMNSLCG